jgi:hypothetical protein
MNMARFALVAALGLLTASVATPAAAYKLAVSQYGRVHRRCGPTC